MCVPSSKLRWPDLLSILCTQLERYATTEACIGEAKQQAALNEFIMQKTKFERLFFFLHGSCYLLITVQNVSN